MGFTKVQIRGHYEDAAGVLQRGTVAIAPTGPVANGATSITATPVLLDIDGSGNISKLVDALDDAGTLPAGRMYNITETILVADQSPVITKYSINVRVADVATGIDLSTAVRYLPAPPYTPTALDLATADARYAPLVRSARQDLGIYLPPGWGATWKARLATAKAGTTTAVMATIGGSSTQGYYASNLRTKGWVGLLQAGLQGGFGDGGSGFRSSSMTALFQNANGVPSGAVSVYDAAGNNAILAGTWTQGAGDYGPGANFVETIATGATWTLSVRGTTAKIFTIDGGHANWTYTVDGGSPTTVTDSGSGTQTIHVTTIGGLAAGSAHQIVITYAGDNVKKLSICGIAGENASGAIVNNLARYGSRAGNFGNVDQTLGAPWMAGPSYPTDLVILTHGPNDAVNSDSGDTWAKNTRRIMGTVREGYPGADLMLVLPHVGKYDISQNLYQDYALRARGLAEVFGAGFVDMWALGRNSWSYWNTAGYWANSASPGASGTDTVHPSDTGHAYIASVVQPLITP